MAATMNRPMAPPIGAKIIPRRAEPGAKTEGRAFWGLGLKPGFCCTPASTSTALSIADITTHTSAKTSGLSKDPLRGTPAKNLTGWSTTLRTTSTKLPTGFESSYSPPDAALLTPIFAPLCCRPTGSLTNPILADLRAPRYGPATLEGTSLTLVRWREGVLTFMNLIYRCTLHRTSSSFDPQPRFTCLLPRSKFLWFIGAQRKLRSR